MDGTGGDLADDLLAQYKFAFDIHVGPVLMVDQDGLIVLANRSAEELFEYPPGGLDGAAVEELVPTDVRVHHPELRQAFFQLPHGRRMGGQRDLQGVSRTGKPVRLEIALESVPAPSGCTWVIAEITDLTARAQVEGRLLAALDAVYGALVMVDQRGLMTMVNRATLAMFGYDEQELVGAPVELLLPERYRLRHPVFVRSYMQARSRREMGIGRQLFGQHKDGHEFPVFIGLTPIETPEGVLVMSSIEDLTERHRSAARIEKSNADLQRVNEELMQFAYSTSHDLKAPLTTVIGLLRFIEQDVLSGELTEALENIRGALDLTERQAARVESVLDLAKSDHAEVARKSVDIGAMIEGLWNELTSDEETSAILTVDLAGAGRICTDETRMYSILENLISNAIKYADHDKPECQVRVALCRTGDDARIVVADNGIGIPEDKHDQVFKMFQRFSDRSAKGSGLGLAMTRKHVQRLGGTITFVTSDKGTEFTVDLPGCCAEVET